MFYTQSIADCFKSATLKNGIERSCLSSVIDTVSPILQHLKSQKNSGDLVLLSLLERDHDLVGINATARQIRDHFNHLIVLGTGGSTLSGQTLVGLRTHLTASPKITFVDNIDPISTDALLQSIDFKSTCFLVISKSGTTLETLSQFTVFHNAAVKALGQKDVAHHFIFLTDPMDNPLRRIGKTLNIQVLDHEPKIGGRFALFTNVGLIPAAVAGLSIQPFREGAHAVWHDCLEEKESAVALGAATNMLLAEQGYHSSVLMPYIDRLSNFTSLIRQLWAESLGKDGKGTTPIKALGTIDQHSQLQLYLDGPKDKLFNLFMLEMPSSTITLDTTALGESALHYLQGKSLSDIMQAEQNATAATLKNKGCPVRTFMLKNLDESTLGALAMHFMLEIIVFAHLMKVNPFDQPAVEEGKLLARKTLENGE